MAQWQTVRPWRLALLACLAVKEAGWYSRHPTGEDGCSDSDHGHIVLRTSMQREQVPGFRGVVTAFFDGIVAVNSPYPKAWQFRMWRTAGWMNGAPWYPSRATVAIPVEGAADFPMIRAMNPAHIIYECYTNKDWGRGLDPANIDEASFMLAADPTLRRRIRSMHGGTAKTVFRTSSKGSSNTSVPLCSPVVAPASSRSVLCAVGMTSTHCLYSRPRMASRKSLRVR